MHRMLIYKEAQENESQQKAHFLIESGLIHTTLFQFHHIFSSGVKNK